MPLKADFVMVSICTPCNNKKAVDDSYIQDMFTNDVACEGNTVVRAILPTVFRSIQKHWSDFGRMAGRQGRLESMSSPGGIYSGHYPAVPIEWKRVNQFFRLVVRGLYGKTSKVILPDDYIFVTLRQPASAFPEQRRVMIERGGNAPLVIGTGVFGCVFNIAEEDHYITHWLMWFYDSIFISVSTGPQDYHNQFDRPF